MSTAPRPRRTRSPRIPSRTERLSSRRPQPGTTRQPVDLLLKQASDSAEALDWSGAAVALSKACQLQPGNSTLFAEWARALRRDGQSAAALQAYQRVIAMSPADAAVWAETADLLLDLEEVSSALAALTQALALDPQLAIAQLTWGRLLRQTGDLDGAIAAWRLAFRLDPLCTPAAVNLAGALRSRGEAAAAAELLRVVVKRDPAPSIQYNLANTLAEMGEFTEARRWYAAALATHPQPAKVFYNLTTITPANSTDRNVLSTARAEVESRCRTRADWTYFHFAVGKMLDDLGECRAAFSHFRQANQLAAPVYTPADHTHWTDRVLAAWRGATPPKSPSTSGATPVFIIGMPRSGTTLVEQILARHPQVTALGERTETGELVEQLAIELGTPSESQLLQSIRPDDLQAFAVAYRNAVGAPASGAFTDKMPTNFLHLGWIALAFPNARFVHCRRDPRDVCLSCYFQHFTARLTFSYDLEHLAAYYRDYERLMHQWRALFGDRILDVSYEALTANPDAVVGRLLSFCGLEQRIDGAAPEQRRGRIATASVWQARQPIYQSSRQRWRHYAADIAPLLEEFGYEATPRTRD